MCQVVPKITFSDKQKFLNEAHDFCENSGEFDYRMFVRKMMSDRVMKSNLKSPSVSAAI